MKLSANHFIPQDQINCSEHMTFHACLYMKKNQSSLHNKLEELTVTDSDCGALDLMHLLDPHK